MYYGKYWKAKLKEATKGKTPLELGYMILEKERELRKQEVTVRGGYGGLNDRFAYNKSMNLRLNEIRKEIAYLKTVRSQSQYELS